MRNRRTDALTTMCAVLLSCLSLAPATLSREYNVDRAAKNNVTFVSDAPIEDFDGVTDAIDGYVILNCHELDQGDSCVGGEFYFEVDLASLDTGIGLRNRHMRENYLETDDYPYASYSGTVERIVHNVDRDFTVYVSGVMSIHGVDKEMEIHSRVVPGGLGLNVQTEFTVSLTDFDIEVPSLMFMKISEEIALKLNFFVEPVEARQETETN